MPFYVLLLRPKVKQFELIKFARHPGKIPTASCLLEQTLQSASHPEFKTQDHRGFYCLETRKEILLVDHQLVDPILPSSIPPSIPPTTVLLSPIGNTTTDDDDGNDDEKVSSLTTTPPASTSSSDSNSNSCEEEEKMIETTTGSGTEHQQEQQQQQDQEHEITQEEEIEKKEKENKEKIESSSEEGIEKVHEKENNETMMTNPFDNIGPIQQQQDQEHEITQEEEIEEEKENEKEKESSSEEVIEKGHKNENDETMMMTNPFDNIGPVLVAIPTGFPLEQVDKMSRLILNSSSFNLLTTGDDIIHKVENTTTTQQELEDLERRGVTKVGTDHFLQTHVAANTKSNEDYEQQVQDLEARRRRSCSTKRRLSSSRSSSSFASILGSPISRGVGALDETVVLMSPPPSAATRTTSRTDSHGLSPFDTMRVKQNQQRAAARQQEQETLQLYSRFNSSTSTHLDTTNTTTCSSSSSGGRRRSSSKTLTPPTNSKTVLTIETVDCSSFNTSPTDVRDFDDDGAGTTTTKDNAATTTTTPQSSSSSSTTNELCLSSVSRKQVINAKKEQELESVRNLRRQSTSSVAETKQQYEVSKSSSSNNKTTFTSPRCGDDNELTRLKAQQGVPNNVKRLSLDTWMSKKKLEQRRSSSRSELEQLRQMGLTKSVKTQFSDSAAENKRKDDAHQAQVRDLEERKTHTTEFKVSVNTSSILSPTDSTHFSYTKRKKEDRRKERETIGYYQSYRDTSRSSGTTRSSSKGGGTAVAAAENEKNDGEWQSTGKAIMTQHGGETVVTTEWKAPATTEADTHGPITTTTTSVKQKRAAPTTTNNNNNKSNETEQVCTACSCIMM